MHFGLESVVSFLLYPAFIAAFLLSVFWRPITGIYFLLPLMPLQELRYHLNSQPLGASVVGITLLGVMLGLMRQGKSPLPKTPWTALLCIFVAYAFVSLWLGWFYIGGPLPLPGDARFGVWQDYMVMPALLLLVAGIAPTKRQMIALLVVMCLSALILDRGFWSDVGGRDFSNYNVDLREGGGMGYAGVNGLAALEAQIAIFLVALAAFERRRLLRLGYLGFALISAVCLMYSLSRGGYVALLAGWLFLGLVKQRTLLIPLIVFGLTWTAVVPNAVRQRVLTTYDEQSGGLERSAETRVTLWEDAMQVFDANPVVGTGFGTYAHMHRIGNYEDTHNYFLKVLVETGILGLLLFLWLLAKMFWTGYRFSRRARDPFLASLGLGFAAWLVCACVANCFGDRWTYLQISGYMWVIGGLVAQALVLEKAGAPAIAEASGAVDALEVPASETADVL
jgi:putative inorganic carbon (HCO3(-)) transporter